MSETQRPEGEPIVEPTGGPAREAAEPTEPEGEVKPPEPTEPEEEVSPETIAHTGKEFVEGLLASMELEADVSTRLEEERAVIDVTGEDLGVLIGRRARPSMRCRRSHEPRSSAACGVGSGCSWTSRVTARGVESP